MTFSILCMLPLLTQQLPDGIPQPTLPSLFELDPWAAEEGWISGERPLWLALAPPWLDRPLATAEQRQELAAAAAARSGMDEARLVDFLEARSMEQVNLHYRLTGDGALLLEGRDRLLPGTPTAFADVWARAVTLDMDVEIASSAAIADPVTGLQWGGRSLTVRLLPVPGRGWVAECALTDAVPEPPRELATGYADIRGLERLEATVGEAGFATLLLPGVPTLVRFPGAGGRMLELELRADAPVPPGVLAFGRGSWLEAGAAAADEHGWERLVRRWLGEEVASGTRQGFLLVEGDGHEARAAALLDGLQQATRPVALRMTWTIERAGAPVDGGVVELSAVAGRALRFASGRVTRVLSDWDVEVALDSRIADPVLRDLLSGVRGSVRPLPVRAGMLLDVDLEFSSLEMGEPRNLLLSAARAPSENADGSMTAGSPEQRVLVDSFDRRVAGFRGRYSVDAEGRVVLERAVPAGWGEGAVLRVVLEASTD